MRFTIDTLELRRLITQYTIRRIADARPLLFFFDDLHYAAAEGFGGRVAARLYGTRSK